MFYLYSCNRDWRDSDPLQWGNKYSAVSTLFGHISKETPGSQNGDSCLFEAEQELHRHPCELDREEQEDLSISTLLESSHHCQWEPSQRSESLGSKSKSNPFDW